MCNIFVLQNATLSEAHNEVIWDSKIKNVLLFINFDIYVNMLRQG